MADATTISFSSPAYSFKLGGSRSLPAESSSTSVAPFRKNLLNSLTLESKSFKVLILAKSGSQLWRGYRVRHFSNPLLITNRVFSPSGSCFFKPAGRRKRPFVSRVDSNSPKKPVIFNGLEWWRFTLTQNNTFSHFWPSIFGRYIFPQR